MYGRLLGIAPNQIFLPAAGWRTTAGLLSDVGVRGSYWSNSMDGGITTQARSSDFSSGSSSIVGVARARGLSIRCVAR